jgi:hypothetical protein
MYLGWTDHDRRRPADEKLGEAVERFRRKFGSEPTTAVISPVDAERIAEGCPALSDGAVLDIKARSYIPAGVFYVGIDGPTTD